MRIARTNGVRISGDARMAAWEKLGPLVVGYQLRATLDAASRPWHAARNGQIYYKNPGPGQLGLDEMPRPPHEPQAAPWGGKIAWNCRCMLSVVFAPPPALTGDRLQPFTNNAGKVIPDPDSYSQWFARADERRRRLAVGSRRYETVVRLGGGKQPTWSDFLDGDGELVPLATLRQETPDEREERRTSVQKMLLRRREDFRRLSTFGFDHAEELPVLRAEPPHPDAPNFVPRVPAPTSKERSDSPWDPHVIAHDQEWLAHRMAKDQESENLRRNLVNALMVKSPGTPPAMTAVSALGLPERRRAPVELSRLPGASPKHHRKAEDAVAFLRNLFGGEQSHAVAFTGTRRRRAYHSSGVVHFHGDSSVGTVLHEIGHQLEHAHPAIAQACRAFLKKRVGSEPPSQFRKVISRRYGASERGCRDDFHKAFGVEGWYVGKHYRHGATEILSMGLEKLYNDPLTFAVQDPEYFNFVVGILHGRLR